MQLLEFAAICVRKLKSLQERLSVPGNAVHLIQFHAVCIPSDHLR
jgi:hypothetical protein